MTWKFLSRSPLAAHSPLRSGRRSPARRWTSRTQAECTTSATGLMTSTPRPADSTRSGTPASLRPAPRRFSTGDPPARSSSYATCTATGRRCATCSRPSPSSRANRSSALPSDIRAGKLALLNQRKEDSMRIGCIGAGNVGATLAGQLTRLGHQAYIANSRGPETLTDVAAQTGATPVPITDVTSKADIVVVAIPEKSITELPAGLFSEIGSEVVVIDTAHSVPRLRDGRLTRHDAA